MKKIKTTNLLIFVITVICLLAISYGIGKKLNSNPAEEKKFIEKQLFFEFGNEFKINDVLDEKKKDEYHLLFMDEDLSNSLKQKTTDQLEIGKYIIEVEYDNTFYRYHLVIRDTVKPIFNMFTKKIYLPNNSEKPNWNDYFLGTDRSKFSINVDDSGVDYNLPGTYKIEVSIEDSEKNKWMDDAEIVLGENNTNDILYNYGKPTYVDGILIVNKLHPIPKNFALKEEELAAQQIRNLIQDMQSNGYRILSTYSGYRNNDYQTFLYDNYVSVNGKEEADTFSARPGYSEHETGLAFDLIDVDGNLVESPEEAKWIAENAHKYGFIVRYPKGKEDITGYMPEAWHLRYVGDKATDIYTNNLTLEEYLNVPGGVNYNE